MTEQRSEINKMTINEVGVSPSSKLTSKKHVQAYQKLSRQIVAIKCHVT